MAGIGASFDRCRDEAVNIQAGTQHMQKIELFLGKIAVGSGNVASKSVCGLTKLLRERLGDQVDMA